MASNPSIIKSNRHNDIEFTLLNKSFLTNFAAAICVAAGLLISEPAGRTVLNIGLFALSGAITNWLAIHMLFEKVPGLYGSGVIPDRFEDFKRGIYNLIMEQFFTKENFERFFKNSTNESMGSNFNFEPIIDEIDLNPSFNALVSVVMESSFGGMLGMLGGIAALDPLKEPFIEKMKLMFNKMTQTQSFQKAIQAGLISYSTGDKIHERVERLVRERLDELTPRMVKDIIQKMIREHLGWLVVWGGVFGGLIGLITTFIPVK